MTEPNKVYTYKVLRSTPDEYVVVLTMDDGWVRIRKIKHMDTPTPKQTEIGLSPAEHAMLKEWL